MELGNLWGSRPLVALLAGTPIPAPGRERGWKHCPTAPPGGSECLSQHRSPQIKEASCSPGQGDTNPVPWSTTLASPRPSEAPSFLPSQHLCLGCPFRWKHPFLPGVPSPGSLPIPPPAPSAFRITPGTTQVITTWSCVCLPHRALSPMRAGTVSALVNTVSPKPETIPVYSRCSIYTVG